MSEDAFTPGLLARLPQPPRKVAIVCASRIGDFICATPAFRALRAAVPAAEITLIGMPFVAQLAARSPRLDRFAEFPGFPGMAEQFFDAPRALEFFAAMQREKFDLAIQVHGSGVYANPFTLMLGARRTAGFVRPGDGAGCLDAALPWPARDRAAVRALRLVEFLGAEAKGEDPELPLHPDDHRRAAAVLAGLPRPWIGLHAGAREPAKQWPAARFRSLAARFETGSLILLGGPEERRCGAELVSGIGTRAAGLAGDLSIPEMAAVIARLDVLITNDSAPAHMAYAAGTPSVTLFGVTDPAEWGPPPREQHRIAVSENGAIASLSEEVVWRAACAALSA